MNDLRRNLGRALQKRLKNDLNMHKNRIWLGFFVGLFIGLTFGHVLARTNEESRRALTEELLDPLRQLVRQIEEHYVEEVEYDELLVGAYEGMLSKLDKHSTYIPPEALTQLQVDIEGEFGGLGIKIKFDAVKKAVQIEEILPATPASRAGLFPGDLIVEILEESTGEVIKTADFESVYDAVKELRGKPDTEVTITVLRAESGEREQITIKRAIITIPGVQVVKVIEQGGRKFGYIKLGYFSRNAADVLERAIEYLQQENIEGLVLDMRFNPGGLLEMARDCADLFLGGDAVIVSTKSRTGPETTLKASRAVAYEGQPIVVLMNKYSASGSEILGAALHDHHKAILVGEATYGKASVQKIINNPYDRKSAIKLTIAHYYTPSGASIEEQGIEPDVECKISEEDTRKLAKYLDSQIRYKPIPWDGEEPEQPGRTDEATTEPGEEPEEEFTDAQLECALEVLAQEVAEAELKRDAPTAQRGTEPAG